MAVRKRKVETLGLFKGYGGPHARWQTMTQVAELEQQIEQYFMNQEAKNLTPTIQGLLLHIDVNLQLWHKYLQRRHSDPTNEIIRVQDAFTKAKLYIESCMLTKGIDYDNKNALWVLSRYRDFSAHYNPKQEIDVTQIKKDTTEEEIDQELLLLEKKEKDFLGE